MEYKVLFAVLLLLDFGYKLLKLFLSNRQKGKPLPKNVRDVYDAERYRTWLEYSAERKKLALCGSAVRLALMLVIFTTNILSLCYNLLPGSEYVKSILLIGLYLLVNTLIGLPFQYISQFKIEEKYGFNRTTHKTFVKDQIISFVLEYGLDVALYSVIFGSYSFLGVYFFPAAFGGIAVILLVSNMFSGFFRRLFNKLTPLPEGALRNKLQRLFVKSGYRLKEIYVMDASKRSTNVNAYCGGLGKYKEIVLYDTLVDNYTEGQIVAVFAHELGHFKRHDTAKMLVGSLLNVLVILGLIALMLAYPQISAGFGFSENSLIFAVLTVLLSDILGLISTLLMACIAWFSRAMERRADAFAASNGYGKELISALKKMSGDDLVDLNPHPFVVAMEYTHPPIHERITLIEKKQKKKR